MVRRVFFHAIFCTLFSCNTAKYPYEREVLEYYTEQNRIYKLDLNKIKLNGFFRQDDGFGLRYFFEDGYCVQIGAASEKNLCPRIDSTTRQIPYFWGVYTIVNDTIRIKRPDSSRSPFGKFEIEEEKIAIINDSTLHWFQRITPEKRIIKMDVWYKFHACANKPSSENVLMRDEQKKEK